MSIGLHQFHMFLSTATVSYTQLECVCISLIPPPNTRKVVIFAPPGTDAVEFVQVQLNPPFFLLLEAIPNISQLFQ